MIERVVPNVVYEMRLEGGGEIRLSPAFDTIHRIRALGIAMIKYCDFDEEVPRFCDVLITEESADMLASTTTIPVAERETITQDEYERWIGWQATRLSDDILGD